VAADDVEYVAWYVTSNVDVYIFYFHTTQVYVVAVQYNVKPHRLNYLKSSQNHVPHVIRDFNS
jgi:hypothetical protein